MHNTEDKQWWVNEGAKAEYVFVNEVCPSLHLYGKINPEKELNPYAPDLIVNGLLSDLKHQTTPFFKSNELYSLDPQFTVTFNQKDYERYSRFYPEIVIYFWVDWLELEKIIRGRTFRVKPMKGVWRVPFEHLKKSISQNTQPAHRYQRRVNDVIGNAQVSFAFDLRTFECLYQEGPA